MAKINKPNYQVLWASSGAITAPDDTKKQTGWVVEKPPHQYDNWLENRQDTAIAHILQHGVPEWDNVTEYRANASYINRSGIVYKCKQTHTNQDPSLDVTNVYWDRAFDIFGSSATVQSNLSAHIANYINGSGINAPNFRTSLGLGTAAVLNFDPNTKVNKTGDTMTGNLALPIVVANTQIQVGSNGNGSSIVYFYDDNDNIYRPFFWSAAGNDWFCHDRFSLEQRVWHSGNDGAGSGLDADLLDGQQGSSYARMAVQNNFLPSQQIGANLTPNLSSLAQVAHSATFKGTLIGGGGGIAVSGDNFPLHVNKLAGDGTLVAFYAGSSTVQGTITLTGTTVSYNSFCGSHWSQFNDHSRPNIELGTVMETIDEMCDWPEEQEPNEQLVKVKVSDTACSPRVYGVFGGWDEESHDMYVRSLGATTIRVTGPCEGGDLLESNGDGTARVQKGTTIKSSTIGKVTKGNPFASKNEIHTVPCVLYCG